MLVGDVYLLRTGLVTDSPMLSAGRPVFSSVIATMLRQVSRAQRPTSARSAGVGCQLPLSSSAGLYVVPADADAVVPTRAVAPAAVSRVRRLMLAVIHVSRQLFEARDGDAL